MKAIANFFNGYEMERRQAYALSNGGNGKLGGTGSERALDNAHRSHSITAGGSYASPPGVRTKADLRKYEFGFSSSTANGDKDSFHVNATTICPTLVVVPSTDEREQLAVKRPCENTTNNNNNNNNRQRNASLTLSEDEDVVGISAISPVLSSSRPIDGAVPVPDSYPRAFSGRSGALPNNTQQQQQKQDEQEDLLVMHPVGPQTSALPPLAPPAPGHLARNYDGNAAQNGREHSHASSVTQRGSLERRPMRNEDLRGIGQSSPCQPEPLLTSQTSLSASGGRHHPSNGSRLSRGDGQSTPLDKALGSRMSNEDSFGSSTNIRARSGTRAGVTPLTTQSLQESLSTAPGRGYNAHRETTDNYHDKDYVAAAAGNGGNNGNNGNNGNGGNGGAPGPVPASPWFQQPQQPAWSSSSAPPTNGDAYGYDLYHKAAGGAASTSTAVVDTKGLVEGVSTAALPNEQSNDLHQTHKPSDGANPSKGGGNSHSPSHQQQHHHHHHHQPKQESHHHAYDEWMYQLDNLAATYGKV